MQEPHMTRRNWLASFGRTIVGALAAGVVVPHRTAAAPTKLRVYKDPSCGCCTKWIAHLRAAGFQAIVQDRSDMDALKNSLGVPQSLRSCHTAVAGAYVIEGHVPAADLKRLLAAAPTGIIGLAVPQMPVGAPGMESGGRADRYDVIAFSADGSMKVFARH